jgi:hypothetical protein
MKAITVLIKLMMKLREIWMYRRANLALKLRIPTELELVFQGSNLE